MAETRAGCDCTVLCGDDPWLKDGRARPCDRKVREDAELQAWMAGERRKALLLRRLGHADVLGALEELARLKGCDAADGD